MLWSAVFLVVILMMQERRAFAKTLWNARAVIPYTVLSATLISVNWLVYIYSVNTGQVLQSSLGYFMAPLVSVFLGTFVLREKLTPRQKLAVGLAALGVAGLVYQFGHVPYWAILLSTSFATYGFIRKKIPIRPMVASTLEAMIQVIPAVIILFVLKWRGIAQHMSWTGRITIELQLLVLGGLITAVPLVWFANAARRLPLSALGLFNYLSPILQFCLAVFVFHETFTSGHLAAFSFIWAGLAVYSFEMWNQHRLRPRVAH